MPRATRWSAPSGVGSRLMRATNATRIGASCQSVTSQLLHSAWPGSALIANATTCASLWVSSRAGSSSANARSWMPSAWRFLPALTSDSRVSIAVWEVRSHFSAPGYCRSGGSAEAGPTHTWTPCTRPSGIFTGSVRMTRPCLGVMEASDSPLCTVSVIAVWRAARYGLRRRNVASGTRSCSFAPWATTVGSSLSVSTSNQSWPMALLYRPMSRRAGRRARRGAQFGQDPPQHRHRPRLVEGIVAVAAFGRLHARGAPARALARRDRVGGRRQPGAGLPEALVGEAGAAGMAVVDEDGGQPGVRSDGGRQPADVAAVTAGHQRQQPDRGVLGGVQRPRHGPRVQAGLGEGGLGDRVHHRDGVEGLCRHVQVGEIDHLPAGPAPQIPGHLLGDVDGDQPDGDRPELAAIAGTGHGDLGDLAGVGAVVGVLGVDERHPRRLAVRTGMLQAVDDVALPLMQVDRAGMHAQCGLAGADTAE